MMRLAVIPARAASTRFPRKVVAPILGRPLVSYIWSAAQEAELLDKVVVAADENEVANQIASFGADVCLTPSSLESGTDRVAFYALGTEAEIILNLQADEPLLKSQDIDRLVDCLAGARPDEMATLAVRSFSEEDWKSPHVVKVVCDENGRAKKFFREPSNALPPEGFLQHIGIYGFRRAALQAFISHRRTESEIQERLEQLRALENGISIRVVLMNHRTIAIDVPSDVQKVEALLKQQQLGCP